MKIVQVLLVALLVHQITCTIYYASPDAQAGNPTCTTQQNPCGGILAALSLAGEGDTVILLPGTFTGPLNVPFMVNQSSLTLQGQPETSIIDCGHVFPYCAQVFVADKTVFQYLTFINYVPFNSTEVEGQNPTPTDGLLQALISIQSIPLTGFIDITGPPPRYNFLINNCWFLNNTSPITTGRDWAQGALVYAYKVFPNVFVDISNSFFENNTISCINTMYSNLNVTNTLFRNNQAPYAPVILSSRIHPWLGGATVGIYSSTFDGNSAGIDQHLLAFDGTFCSFDRVRNTTTCYPYEIDYCVFTNNGGARPLIVLDNAAQLSIVGSDFELNDHQMVISSQAGYSRSAVPSQLNIQATTFNNDNNVGANVTAISGYFTNSLIANSKFVYSSIMATGELTLDNCEFTISSTAINFAYGTLFIGSSTFNGWGGGDLYAINSTALSVNWPESVMSTIVIRGSYFLNSPFLVAPGGMFYLDGVQVTFLSNSTADSAFDCESDSSGSAYPSELNFIGAETSVMLEDVDMVNSESCLFVCNQQNTDICGDDDVQQLVERTDLDGWQWSLIIVFVLVFIWAVIASGILLVIVYQVQRSKWSYNEGPVSDETTALSQAAQ